MRTLTRRFFDEVSNLNGRVVGVRALPRNGLGVRVLFPNGYGADIASSELTIGGERGLYELAVIDRFEEVVEGTEITPDYIGNLQEEEITPILARIAEL